MHTMRSLHNIHVLKESPFTPQKRQCMALVHKDGVHTLIVKGSPEVVIEKCTFLSDQEKHTIQDHGLKQKKVREIVFLPLQLKI